MKGLRFFDFPVALGVVLVAVTSSPSFSQQQTLPVVPAMPAPTFPVEQKEAPIRPGAKMKRIDPGKKIVDRFDANAGDRDVVVERWVNDETEGPPLGYSPIAWQTIFSPVVMVVKVASVEGYVTNDEQWIDSRVTGTITQLVKNSTSANLQLNSTVTFITDDGVLRLGDNTIETISRDGRNRGEKFRKNREYLIFTVKRDGDVLYAYPPIAFEVVGKHLRPMRGPNGSSRQAFGAAGADAVIAEAVASRSLEAPLPRRRPRGGVQ